ncbi:MAG: GH92 family glycosyl hydrolase [Bacteroidales bacterium]|nr:GH92 family glycosyl hydrolase [Bacteroidales bacterium]
MSFQNRLLASAILIISLFSCTNQQDKLTNYVDPFIGTGGHGHTYPGATLPFGMVQLSPDTRINDWDGCSGYHYSDSTILGFSHTHLSGTGVGDYGDIRFMPTVGKLKTIPGNSNRTIDGYRSSFSKNSEFASPGFYKVHLDDYTIDVELAATERAGIHKYSFPKSDSAHMIIDLTESVVSEKILDLEINFENDSTLSGKRQSSGWAADQHIYFVAQFSKPFLSFGIAEDGALKAQLRKAKGLDLKAWVDFQTKANEEILVKVGISAVSIEGARKNLASEIPDWDFEKIKKTASEKWEKELNKIKVEGSNETDKTIFYTALYHSLLAPNIFSDVDGKYRGHDQQIHQADHPVYTVFSLWDTFRAEHPLLSIIDQKRSNDMIKSMLLMYEQGGLLPVWELAANETNCMIGYHAVPVIADAIMKNIGDIDQNKAFEAMRKSAESDLFGLRNYKEFGYVKADEESESVSRTLEYAFDDWCIAQIARNLNDSVNESDFSRRAQNYQNVFDPSVGFMRARINGGWQLPFSPTEVNFHFTEANSWQYSLFVPQDINRLIQFLGDDEGFDRKLDELFSTGEELSGRHQSDITGLIGQYAHGNEPSHHMAYLYNYIGKPYKSQEIVHQIKTTLYSAKPDGLSGNEDCGQMSAWYVMSALGFYQVAPASNMYIIGTPTFDKASITLENGKTFSINAKGASKENYFVQQASLNNNPYPKSYFSHQVLENGGILNLKMADTPNPEWGFVDESRPKQLIEENRICPTPSISAETLTFRDSLKIEMDNLLNDAEIYFTLDGSEPTKTSAKYNSPFYIKNSSRFRAMAYHSKFGYSQSIEASFYKVEGSTSISLANPYSNLYSAGGDLALIDQVRGNANFKTGTWQGFYGVDLEAVLDLGKNTPVAYLELGCIQDTYSWIFMPEKVSFYTSINGSDWDLAGIIPNTVDEKQQGGIIKKFNLNLVPKRKVRFIKVVAKNRGLCPDWHVGAGNKSWIFADEIVVN